MQDWTDPAANYPYNFNHQSQPANKSYGTHYYPPWDWLPEFGISDKMSVGNWKDFLLSVGHTVIAYSQAGPQDRLDVAVKEFEDTVVPLVRQDILTGNLAGKKVTVLAHSRGGLLIRKYLSDVDTNESGAWIKTVITLHSPHTGSRMAEIDDLAWLAGPILGDTFLGPITGTLLGLAAGYFVGKQFTPALEQMDPDDPLFDELDSEHSPNRAIAFYTLGGTSVTGFRIYVWWWTASSFWPTGKWWKPWTWRWHWEKAPTEVPLISPLLDAVPNVPGFDEIAEGEGDILVANERSKLGFAIHASNPLNHVEALWDPNLFSEVLSAIHRHGVLSSQRIDTPASGGRTSTPLVGTAGSSAAAGGYRYYGNRRSREFHDLRNPTRNCQTGEIVKGIQFGPDLASTAISQGYDGCYYCIAQYHTR